MDDALLSLLRGREGHFRMESGFHSEQWFELDRLFDQPERIRPFAVELARRLSQHGIEAVCGPVTGGARLAEMIAQELEIVSFAAEREEDHSDSTALYPIRYRLAPESRARAHGKAIAIVDDAISAGSAVRGAHADLLAGAARPVAVGALIVFGDKAASFATEHRLQLECIAQATFRMWPPSVCPLCQRGVPLERVSDAI